MHDEYPVTVSGHRKTRNDLKQKFNMMTGGVPDGEKI